MTRNVFDQSDADAFEIMDPNAKWETQWNKFVDSFNRLPEQVRAAFHDVEQIVTQAGNCWEQNLDVAAVMMCRSALESTLFLSRIYWLQGSPNQPTWPYFRTLLDVRFTLNDLVAWSRDRGLLLRTPAENVQQVIELGDYAAHFSKLTNVGFADPKTTTFRVWVDHADSFQNLSLLAKLAPKIMRRWFLFASEIEKIMRLFTAEALSQGVKPTFIPGWMLHEICKDSTIQYAKFHKDVPISMFVWSKFLPSRKLLGQLHAIRFGSAPDLVEMHLYHKSVSVVSEWLKDHNTKPEFNKRFDSVKDEMYPVVDGVVKRAVKVILDSHGHPKQLDIPVNRK